MDCNTVRRLIVLLLDNELSEEKMLKLNEHLELCPKCSDEMAAIRRATDALDAWEDMQPSFSLADIRARASTLRPWWRKIHLPYPARLPVWSTSVGIVVCVGIGVIGGLSLDKARKPANHAQAVDTIVVGFDDPVGDSLLWIVHPDSDSRSTKRSQEDSL